MDVESPYEREGHDVPYVVLHTAVLNLRVCMGVGGRLVIAIGGVLREGFKTSL